jgi:hypothetical protein
MSLTGTDSDETLLVKFANYTLNKVFKTAFVMTFLFFCNPFIAYLVFKNKGAFEVTYTQLLQVYGYSFTIFVPVAVVYIIAAPLYRLRLFILLVSGAISVYYLYKETKDFITKYFDDNTLRSFGIYIGISTSLFLLLFRYYFIQE